MTISNTRRSMRYLGLAGGLTLALASASSHAVESQTRNRLPAAVQLATFIAPAPERNPPEIVEDKGLPKHPIPESAGYTKAFRMVAIQPASQDERIILSTVQNIKTAYPTYIYELARRLFRYAQNDAAAWLVTADIRAQYDALRCTDASARQGIIIWRDYTPKVRAHLAGLDQQTRDKIIKLGVKRARKIGLEATPPEWICFHGLQAVKHALNKEKFIHWMTPESQWQRALDKVVLAIEPKPKAPTNAKKHWTRMNGFDLDDRIAELRPLAQGGDVKAQMELANIFDRSGYRDIDDPEKSHFWFMQAAENGNAEAQHRAGRNLVMGTGTPQDMTQGYKWMLIADRRGYRLFTHWVEDTRDELSRSQAKKAEAQAEAWIRAHN